MNELADNLLYNTAQQPGKHRENRVFTSTDDENTFVARFSTTFASDSDPEYLKKNNPDLFMFGGGDFGEIRKIEISGKAYLAYLLNPKSVSIRRFFVSVLGNDYPRVTCNFVPSAF